MCLGYMVYINCAFILNIHWDGHETTNNCLCFSVVETCKRGEIPDFAQIGNVPKSVFYIKSITAQCTQRSVIC